MDSYNGIEDNSDLSQLLTMKWMQESSATTEPNTDLR